MEKIMNRKEIVTEGSDREEKFFTKTSGIQIGYGLWVSLINIVIGLALGFPSNSIPQMVADPDFIIKTSDEAWIASVLALAAPVGCLVGGYAMDFIGRKYGLVIGGLIFAIGWFIMGTSKTSMQVIIGRVVTGVGLGISLGTPRVYITEICLPNMRGVIIVFTSLGVLIGLTLQASVGSYFRWNYLCYAYGGLSVAIGLSCIFLPETPYYVLMKSTQENAENILKRFRGKNHDVETEIYEMIEFKTSNDIERLSVINQLKLLMTKSACLPFWIMLAYILASQLSGASIIFVWTIDLLQASNLVVAPRTAHFSMEMLRLIVGVISAFLMYKMGRRPQALISSIGVGVVCISLSLSMIYYAEGSRVFPFVCYLLYVTFSTLGYYTLPFTMMYEVYPLQLRGLLVGITNAVTDFMIFGVNVAYPFLRDIIGHVYIIVAFGVSSFLATIFLFLCLPETKGLTLQEIEEYYNDRRPTLVSQRSVIAAQKSRLLSQSMELSLAKRMNASGMFPKIYK